MGTGVGVATFGLGKGVAKTAKGVKNWLGSGEAVKNTAAKAGDFLGDLPEEVGRKIIANSSIKDMTPKGNTELAQAVEKTANRLRDEMAEESGKAWKALEAVDKEVDLHLKGASIFDFPVPGFEKTVREEFAGIADDVLTTMNIKNSSQAAQKRAASYVQAAQDDFIKANNFADLKRVIQNIDKNIDWDDPGKSVANEALTKYRTYVDDLLKQINTDYRDAMVPVAKKSAMYDKLMPKFGLKNGKAGVEYTDRSVSTAKNLVDDMTKDTKSVLKGDLKEVDNALFNEFDISSIYKKSGGDTGRGSRSVVGGGLTSAALGSVFGGPGGGIAGAAVGGLAGLARDKYGRKVASSLLAKSSDTIKGTDVLAQRTVLALDAAWDGLEEPVKKLLANAAERGLPGLVSTWATLNKSMD